MATREQIYVALWNLIVDDPAVRGVFVTSGRFLVDLANMKPEECPAMFLVQQGETWVKQHNLPAKRTLQASFVMYASTPDPRQQLPATLLNNMMDVFETKLEFPDNPTNVQTLGGLVDHAHIDGEVQQFEGMFATGQQVSVMVVPVNLLIP